MSLYINNNPAATRTANTLTKHYSELAKSTQRLSTGLRINGASDDAAGLAIRELMRGDLAAVGQGIRNANDAISMLQTADGALGIIDEKLIRMKELAEQASTGTYNSTQRLMIDSEFQQMASEIERIAQATEFNGVKLLNYNIAASGTGSTTDPNADLYNTPVVSTSGIQNRTSGHPSASVSGDPTASLSNLAAVDGTTTITVTNANVSKVGSTDVIITTSLSNVAGSLPSSLNIHWDDSEPYVDGYTPGTGTWVIENAGYTKVASNPGVNQYSSTPSGIVLGTGSGTNATININATSTSGINGVSTSINVISPSDNPTYNYTLSGAVTGTGTITMNNGDNILDFTFDLGNGNTVSQSFSVSGSGADAYTLSGFTTTLSVTKKAVPGGSEPIPDDVVKIHFGPGNDSSEDYYYIDKQNVTLDGLGLSGVDIKTQDHAQQALKTVEDAIITKDKVRAYYGAMQNRMENTMTTLQVQSENLQAAESRISDADVATEMMNFVRNQILAQSSVAMLAQANSMPQMAMRLIG